MDATDETGTGAAGGWKAVGGAAKVVRADKRPDARAGAQRSGDRPDATLRDLVGVIPVAESRRAGDTTLTLLSVERYRDGWLAQFRLLQEYAPPETIGERAGLMPELRPVGTDDRGGRYAAWGNGGSGGGGRGLLHWRYAYRFAPAPDPAVRELRIEIARLEWRKYDAERQEMVLDRDQAGPWRFTVPLTPLAVTE